MNDDELRHLLSDALDYASVPGFAGSERQLQFIAGGDVRLSELEIDSLAAMEICIAIETNFDVSIVPNDLPTFESLGALVKRIKEMRGA